ncbi:TIGR00730 family Rossman fold protein [Croceicoccus bisphenolivorans]|uniref:LOG family protein n=1 Tax=Croceicoccus bisphenolivorans TaxID=1783232 RepID=UPI001C12A569|nr:TIGR00730 family Rossman fold protein [Croceicoccus bisphenolivorans]
MKRLAVYCGSAPGKDPAHVAAATGLGKVMAGRGIDLVYGGGKLGLMGTIADAVLGAGGRVYGVIPSALVSHEVAHLGLTELHEVADMHQRKAKMTQLADGFLCLAGGIGTFDELFEAWTWNALGYHAKPFCLLNTNGYWDKFLGFCDHVRDEGFMSGKRRDQLLSADTIDEALAKLEVAASAAQNGPVW